MSVSLPSCVLPIGRDDLQRNIIFIKQPFILNFPAGQDLHRIGSFIVFGKSIHKRNAIVIAYRLIFFPFTADNSIDITLDKQVRLIHDHIAGLITCFNFAASRLKMLE